MSRRPMTGRTRVFISLRLCVVVVGLPLFVVWYGIRETPDLIGEIFYSIRVIRAGRYDV